LTQTPILRRRWAATAKTDSAQNLGPESLAHAAPACRHLQVALLRTDPLHSRRQLFQQLRCHDLFLFLDGVYVYRDNRPPRFQRVKAPAKSELEELLPRAWFS